MSTANTIPTGGKAESFLYFSGHLIIQRCHFHLLLFNKILEVLSKATVKRKK
jgi:hypothetical protein